jgi:hypothetical protein
MPDNAIVSRAGGSLPGTGGGSEAAGTRLRPCPDCGHQVSLAATSCPSCGRPFGPAPRAREGLFLQTLNGGCMLVVGTFVGLMVLGTFLIVAEAVNRVLHLVK